MVPLTSELKRTAGVFAETAWAGAAYYLLLFMLASHVSVCFPFNMLTAVSLPCLDIFELLYTHQLAVASLFLQSSFTTYHFAWNLFLVISINDSLQIVGAFWYLLAIERNDTCWQTTCSENGCNKNFLYCGNQNMEGYSAWQKRSESVLKSQCSADNGNPTFDYGIFSSAFSSGIVSSKKFVSKYCYCLWWGLQNLRWLNLLPLQIFFMHSVAAFITDTLWHNVSSELITDRTTFSWRNWLLSVFSNNNRTSEHFYVFYNQHSSL